jgi:hypothetical protein
MSDPVHRNDPAFLAQVEKTAQRMGKVTEEAPPAPKFRCTFEWDQPTKKDDRGDTHYLRHICALPMHHPGFHRSEAGATAKNPKREVK